MSPDANLVLSTPTNTVNADSGARLKEALYELVEVPERFGPVQVVVDEAKVRAHAFAQGDYKDWYFADSPFGGRIAHPLVLANDLLFLFYQGYDGNTAQGLHTHERLTFHAPIPVGETVTISGAYTDKYERRGNGYVVLDAEARGSDGRLLVTHSGREIMRAVAGKVVGRASSRGRGVERTVTGYVDERVPPMDRAEPGLPVGTALTTLTRSFTQDQMNTFSWAGRGYANVHTSLDRARKAGLDRTLVQAQQQVGLLVERLTFFFGTAMFTGAELDLRFVAPAFVGEPLTAGGAVHRELDDRVGRRLELEVWVTNEQGQRTALGWASAYLDRVTPGPKTLIP